MKKRKIQLKSYINQNILYEGWYSNIKQCVEDAVFKGIRLDGVDLSHANLSCANLDDARMVAARLCSANLNGANVSEGVFDYSDFSYADMSHACFARSHLQGVNFSSASFSATDLTDSFIARCQFSCPSIFGNLFHRAEVFKDCLYYADNGIGYKMSRPPIMVQGMVRDIVFLDDVIKLGKDFILKADIIGKHTGQLEKTYGDEIAFFLIAGVKKYFAEKV